MADEVYKILQSRLRRNAQHTNCGDQPDCDVHRNTLSEESNSQTRKKTRVAPPGAEVKNIGKFWNYSGISAKLDFEKKPPMINLNVFVTFHFILGSPVS